MRILAPLLLASLAGNFLVQAVDPDLPFGDINVVVLTDVHSWVGGHRRQEPAYDADYGDVLSFYEHLKAHSDAKGADLWFVSNGDWVDGTGLSAPHDPSSLVPILEKMPWDAVNCGNHELYRDEVVEYMLRPGGFVDWWGDKYLTANVMRATENREPLGQRYKVLKGKNSNLLVFGFLYNLEDPCDSVYVAKVESVIKEKWFKNALAQEKYDAVMVLAHMDLIDPLVNVIRKAIRDHVGGIIPIQFITGHTHYRGVVTLDETSTSFEAGRYLDTVGFVSFPRAKTVAQVGKVNATGLFKSVFIDASKEALANTIGIERCETHNGRELSRFIEKTRQKMGLMDEIGCAPQNFYINTTIDDEQSLWRLYRDEVVPKMFFSLEDTGMLTSIMFISKESWRYDLLSSSNLVVDDIWAVAPFNDTVTYMGTFPGSALLQLNVTMNENHSPYYDALPNYVMIGDIFGDMEKEYKLYTHDFSAYTVKAALEDIVPGKSVEPEPTAYTSTIIWLSFVMENWACNGLLGELPDWFPTPDHVAKNLGTGRDGDGMERAVAIVLAVFFCLVACTCLACCWISLRYICSGHQPIAHDELDSFNLDRDEDDEYSIDEKKIGVTLTDDDHEML